MELVDDWAQLPKPGRKDGYLYQNAKDLSTPNDAYQRPAASICAPLGLILISSANNVVGAGIDHWAHFLELGASMDSFTIKLKILRRLSAPISAHLRPTTSI